MSSKSARQLNRGGNHRQTKSEIRSASQELGHINLASPWEWGLPYHIQIDGNRLIRRAMRRCSRTVSEGPRSSENSQDKWKCSSCRRWLHMTCMRHAGANERRWFFLPGCNLQQHENMASDALREDLQWMVPALGRWPESRRLHEPIIFFRFSGGYGLASRIS